MIAVAFSWGPGVHGSKGRLGVSALEGMDRVCLLGLMMGLMRKGTRLYDYERDVADGLMDEEERGEWCMILTLESWRYRGLWAYIWSFWSVWIGRE